MLTLAFNFRSISSAKLFTFIFRGLNTAAAETLPETVLRRPWLPWMEPSIVSKLLFTTGRTHVTSALFSCRPRSRLWAGSDGDYHTHVEIWRRNHLHGRRVRRWGGSDSCAETHDVLNACRFLVVVGGWKAEDLCQSFGGVFFLTCKAQTATSKELPVIWVWRWRWLTVPNQRSLKLPWSLTPK